MGAGFKLVTYMYLIDLRPVTLREGTIMNVPPPAVQLRFHCLPDVEYFSRMVRQVVVKVK